MKYVYLILSIVAWLVGLLWVDHLDIEASTGVKRALCFIFAILMSVLCRVEILEEKT